MRVQSMKQPTRLTIYHSEPEEGRSDYHPVCTYTVDSSGRAVAEVYEDSGYADLARSREHGLPLRSAQRRVTEEEGSLFLEALKESFYNNSYWRVVDESDAEGQSLLMAAAELADNARHLVDMAVAAGVAGALVDNLRSHHEAASQLRDAVHDSLLKR
jgi:hypothetical protein